MTERLILGIDIGTTTVKACLVAASTRQVVSSASRETKASCASDLGPLGSEQDVHKICTALQFCVSRMPKESLVRVTHVAVSGQMHGVVMWKSGNGWRRNNFGRYETEQVSCLYTWQDARCSSEFLRSLPPPDSHLRLSAGHGCATLFWLARNRPDTLSEYDAAGTVQDLVAAMVCGMERPVMSAQNAAGWGYFDTETRTWNMERLKEADFPVHLLPEVTVAGSVVGHMPCAWYGIPEGTPVFAALGDLQCSVFSSMETDHDADTEDSLSSTMYHALSLGYPYSGLTLEERINLHKAITKPEDIVESIDTTLALFKQKLRQFTKDSVQKVNISDILWEDSYRCEEVFSRCSVGFEIINCCAVFVPILTTFGYCFALKINKTSLGTFEMETLPFIIDLHVPVSNTTDSEEGYLLLVHDPRFSPRMILPKDGFLVAPGVTMSLRLTLRITDYSAKYARWFGLVTDCPKVACMGEDYSIQECIFQNAAAKIRDACHCAWILDECKSGARDVPVCGPKKMTECVIIKATQILSDLLKKCQPPCLEYIFEAASSYAQLRYNYSLQERSRISISYNTISYYHNIYHKHYLSSLFSDIGGAMGLLLGASCLTGVELLTFLGQWIYFTFLKKL